VGLVGLVRGSRANSGKSESKRSVTIPRAPVGTKPFPFVGLRAVRVSPCCCLISVEENIYLVFSRADLSPARFLFWPFRIFSCCGINSLPHFLFPWFAGYLPTNSLLALFIAFQLIYFFSPLAPVVLFSL